MSSKKLSKDRLRWLTEVLFLFVFLFLLKNRMLQKWFIIFALGAGVAAFFNRFYCSWACPMATLFRPINWLYSKLKIKRLDTPDFLQKNWIRYLFLVLFIMGMVIVKTLGLKINILFYITIFAVSITLIFKEELWHNNFCPFGTILFIVSRKAFFGLKINKGKCTDCGLCTQGCPVKVIEGSDGYRVINHNHCLSCFKCQDVCPVDAVKYGKIPVK